MKIFLDAEIKKMNNTLADNFLCYFWVTKSYML